MGTKRFMLDTNIIIGVLNNSLNLRVFLETFPDSEIYINPIVFVEVLAKADMNKTAEAAARSMLAFFHLAEINIEIAEIAIGIRRVKKLLLPDALIAASAIALNAIVLSNDSHLRDFIYPGYASMAVN
jgi:predicted nucleic acid-binding protein